MLKLPPVLKLRRITAAAPSGVSLTARVRALYEDSVVPVREIARLAGVTERTIYKYAHKEGWTPRVTRLSRDGTAAGLAGRGVAGRFIRREDEGKPHARGLKALDPDGAARAAAACVRAGELSDAAVAQASAAAASRAARAQAARDAALVSAHARIAHRWDGGTRQAARRVAGWSDPGERLPRAETPFSTTWSAPALSASAASAARRSQSPAAPAGAHSCDEMLPL